VRALGFRAVVEQARGCMRGACCGCVLTQQRSQVLVFVNAFLLLSASNRVAVFGVHGDGCHLLYESPELASAPEAGGAADAAGAALLHAAHAPPAEALQTALKALAGAAPDGVAHPSPLSGAVSRALCYIQRCTRGATTLAPRILALHGSPDTPAQYVAMMNAIFSAQAGGVPIDACLLGGGESAFLQQASSLTGGVYLRPARPAALLQYLLSVFAADAGSRRSLALPQPRGVDFRASCFCHKRALDVGYVCSVCLSIFCSLCEECSTCGTPFQAVKRAGGA
jgi:transcription initiation factor TFIIH subunit 3